jgi:N,N'-diacetylchitobiose transport system substrate-binding protein
MKKRNVAVAAATAIALTLVGCSSTDSPSQAGGSNITLWLNGGDTPDALRDYLKTEFADATGGTLTIEEQSWRSATRGPRRSPTREPSPT